MSRKNPAHTTVAQPPRQRPAASLRHAPTPVRKPFRLTPGTCLKAIASLRLTVILMLMSMVLVYAGTLAQVEMGIWQVVDRYFWSLFVWIPLKNLIPGFMWPGVAKLPTWLGIPFVGGKLLGFLLLINLLSAHATRFKISWKRSGIWLIHLGLILLLVGEAITRMQAVEYRMSIEEGKSRDYIEDHHHAELVFIDLSDPMKDRIVSIPASRLRPGRRISDDSLPVDVEVLRYMENSELKRRPPTGEANPATDGVGLIRFAEHKPVVSGVAQEQTIDTPSAYVRLIDKEDNKPIGTFLVTTLLDDSTRIDLNDKPYSFSLRFRREYLPYRLHLTKFTHDVYEGTERPKDFRSHVILMDEGTEREVEIYMNAPLRYRGKTFFQADFFRPETHGPGMRGTILQVVDNPGWLIPYISCVMVSLGMLVHFGINMTQFAGRQLRSQGVKS